jgi:hypothetical protein
VKVIVNCAKILGVVGLFIVYCIAVATLHCDPLEMQAPKSLDVYA